MARLLDQGGFMNVLAAALSLLIGAAPQAPAAPATGRASQRLAADTPMTTSAGATFTAPAGWSVNRRGNVVVLDAAGGGLPPCAGGRRGADADAAADAAAGPPTGRTRSGR